MLLIRPSVAEDETRVIELWRRCDLTRPWNDPAKDIERERSVQPDLFLAGEVNGVIVATAMGGYTGHRGWVHYLGVDPDHRFHGYGRQMMEALEQRLLALGCPKLNLQVRNDNPAAIAFHENIGYRIDPVVSLGKRLIPDS